MYQNKFGEPFVRLRLQIVWLGLDVVELSCCSPAEDVSPHALLWTGLTAFFKHDKRSLARLSRSNKNSNTAYAV